MKLFVFHNNVDLTLKMDDFTKPVKVIDLDSGSILVGYSKPVCKIYVECEEREVVDTVEVCLYSNGAYSASNVVEDRTFGITKPGFIS